MSKRVEIFKNKLVFIVNSKFDVESLTEGLMFKDKRLECTALYVNSITQPRHITLTWRGLTMKLCDGGIFLIPRNRLVKVSDYSIISQDPNYRLNKYEDVDVGETIYGFFWKNTNVEVISHV